MNAIAQVEQRQATPVQVFVGHVLDGDKRDEIERALPAHVPFARFERNLSNAIMREPKLLKCDPRVVFREVAKIAALGLVLDPQLGEAYLIVDNKNNVQARVGYRGLLKLAHQSNAVSAIYAHDICENDVCEIELGTDKRIVHKPDFMKDRGATGAYYAVVKFKDGATDFEPMSLAEIHRIRDRSDAYRAFKNGYIKSTPWGTDEGEMAKKTALRRLLKRVPMSPDVDRALVLEDEADIKDHTIEGTVNRADRPRTLEQRLDALVGQEPSPVEYDSSTGEVAQSPAEPEKPADEVTWDDPAPEDKPAGIVLKASGDHAAASGMAALRAFWEGLTKEQRVEVGGAAQIDAWKKIAASADSTAASGDNPRAATFAPADAQSPPAAKSRAPSPDVVAALMSRGEDAASRGSSILQDWLDNLTGAESAIVSANPAALKDWRATAAQMDAAEEAGA